MAKRRKRRSARKKKHNDYPGWVWLIFGLAIGLSVAFAVHVKDRKPTQQAALDDNGETAAQQAAAAEPATTVAEEPPKRRFDFYDMLPAFEIIIADEEPAINADVEPRAIVEPGIYMLQAGSFSTHGDADRRRAELAFHGIESRVQRARVNNRDYYRVYVGPIEDLDKLNLLRSRLRAAKIDVLRIRLGD